MSLIIDNAGPDAPRVVGVVCDRCKAEVRDSIELGEVLHIRLHAGLGSIWRDGNKVEADLCDSCGHQTLAQYARVMPSAEVLPGHVAHGFDPRRVEAVLHASPGILMGPIDDALVPTLRASGAWAWIGYHALRYLVPAKVLLSPVFSALRGFFQSIKREERKLRLRFGRQ